MNSTTTQPTDAKPVDPDLAQQAVPGHGVPSQDPSHAAQVGLSPEEAERESKSVLMGVAWWRVWRQLPRLGRRLQVRSVYW